MDEKWVGILFNRVLKACFFERDNFKRGWMYFVFSMVSVDSPDSYSFAEKRSIRVWNNKQFFFKEAVF